MNSLIIGKKYTSYKSKQVAGGHFLHVSSKITKLVLTADNETVNGGPHNLQFLLSSAMVERSLFKQPKSNGTLQCQTPSKQTKKFNLLTTTERRLVKKM